MATGTHAERITALETKVENMDNKLDRLIELQEKANESQQKINLTIAAVFGGGAVLLFIAKLLFRV